MADDTNLVDIRRATRKDMAAIAAMAGEFHAFLASFDGSDPAFDIDGTAEKLVRSGFGDKPRFSSVIAEIGNEPVGYALYNIGIWAKAETFQDMVFLTDLFVREAWRSLGIGKQIMHQMSVIGRDEGCELIMWTVWTRNESARQFYKKLGAISDEEELLMTLSI